MGSFFSFGELNKIFLGKVGKTNQNGHQKHWEKENKGKDIDFRRIKEMNGKNSEDDLFLSFACTLLHQLIIFQTPTGPESWITVNFPKTR